MEDLFNVFEQCVTDGISEARTFVSEQFKVLNEKIVQGTNSTRRMKDLLEELNQCVTVVDEILDTRIFFSGEFEVFKEKIKSLKDEKIETEEGTSKCHTKAMDDLFKKFQQRVIDEITQRRIFASRELKVMNEKIEKAETYSGMDFFDLYAQENFIGEGSMGRVYRVHDLETRKLCAMKSIGLEDNQLTPWVAREMSTLLDIEHDNIVKLEKVHPSEGALYLIMEYGGDNLRSIIQKGGKINGNIAKAWLKAFLLAIDYLHERDLIHCNLKPENVLIDSSLKLKIAGFGSVKNILADMTLSPVVTTIPFKAPELLLGSNGYGKPIDIWAVGCIFAEMVEGKSLFGSEDESDTGISILNEIFRKIGTPSQQSWLSSLPNFPNDVHQYPEASEIIPNLDAVGNDLIKKMLAVDPLERITARDALKHAYIKCFEAGDVSVGEIA